MSRVLQTISHPGQRRIVAAGLQRRVPADVRATLACPQCASYVVPGAAMAGATGPYAVLHADGCPTLAAPPAAPPPAAPPPRRPTGRARAKR